MSWTKWYNARAINEYEQEEIAFTGLKNSSRSVTSITPVSGVSLSTGNLVTKESNALLYQDFNLPSVSNITALELEVTVSRLARIQDKQIQLYFNGLIGSDQSNLFAPDLHVYGRSESDWNITFDEYDFTDPEFGVVLDYQPHTQYPSSNLVYLRRVRVRLQYN